MSFRLIKPLRMRPLIRPISTKNNQKLIWTLKNLQKNEVSARERIFKSLQVNGLVNKDDSDELVGPLRNFIDNKVDNLWNEELLMRITKTLLEYLASREDYSEQNSLHQEMFFNLDHVLATLRKDLPQLLMRKPEIYISCHLYECLALRESIMRRYETDEISNHLKTCSNFSFAVALLSSLLTRKDFDNILTKNPVALCLNPRVLSDMYDYTTDVMGFQSRGEVTSMEERQARQDRFAVKISIGEARIWDAPLHFQAKPVTSWERLLFGNVREICRTLSLENEDKSSEQLTPADLRILDKTFERLLYSPTSQIYVKPVDEDLFTEDDGHGIEE